MSYTFKEVSWEARKPQNLFGDIEYENTKSIKARKQLKQELIKTAEGKEVLSKSIFYVESYTEAEAFNIAEMDKLDGETIIQKYEMCDLVNNVILIKFATV